MDLADDCVARNASQPSGDLTGAEPFRPELLQKLNPFIRPRHTSIAPCRAAQNCGVHPPVPADETAVTERLVLRAQRRTQ